MSWQFSLLVIKPPPLPTPGTDRESLRNELRELDTGELLALGARLRRDPDRLSLYLGILRERSGGRAQLAACLVCFDLARLGNRTAQREFFALIPTIRDLARDPALVAELAGNDPYLISLWEGCEAALVRDDPRDIADGMDASVPVVGELDLLSDLDAGSELQFELLRMAESAQQEEHATAFARLTASQLGYDLANDIMPTVSGLSTGTSVQLDRLEQYLRQAGAYAPNVPLARGLACLGQLFLAAHLRRHRFFGKPNPRRVEALRAGLAALPSDSPAPLAEAAALIEEEGARVVEGFQKAAEILLDYLRYCAQSGLDPLQNETVESYVTADRLPAPTLLVGDSRRRR